VNFEAWISRPNAVGPGMVTDLPLPPVPVPKQSAFGLVFIDAVPAPRESSARTLPLLLTTRRLTSGPFANAEAAVERANTTTSAHAATSRNEMDLGI
jgi:hypothetical protein